MQIHEVIQSRRRALGLTQEQVAEALGVTAPAVNKWEKAATCPDIALLAPLARLLGVDLNELLGFHENLTEQEVQRFTLEVMRAADRDGLDAGFALAREQLRRYPNSDYLAYNLATILTGLLSLAADAQARENYEDQITQWYERAAQSDDPKVRNHVPWMLASRNIRRKDWDAAQRSIDALPERQPIDRRALQAQLLSARDNPNEAAKLLEEVVLAAGQELSAALVSLVDAEIAAGEMDAADFAARSFASAARALDQWDYMPHTAPLQVAMAKKDVRESVRLLRALFEALDEPWKKPFESPLYRRIAAKEPSGAVNERIFALLLKDLATNPSYDFLREDGEFQELIQKYQSRAEQA